MIPRHFDPDPPPRGWVLCGGAALDALAVGAPPWPEPAEPDPVDEGRLALLDRLVRGPHFTDLDRLVHALHHRRGVPLRAVAAAAGIAPSEAVRRAASILDRLRILAAAPPLPALAVVRPVLVPAVPEPAVIAAHLHADFRPLAAVADALALRDRRRASEAVRRGVRAVSRLDAPEARALSRRVAYRRASNWGRGPYRAGAAA